MADNSSYTDTVTSSHDAQRAKSVLIDAIHSATIERLRQVLTDTCTENQESFKFVRNQLLIDPEDPHGEEHRPESAGSKRKRAYTQQRYEICSQCGREYNVTQNTEPHCVWHEGMYIMFRVEPLLIMHRRVGAER